MRRALLYGVARQNPDRGATTAAEYTSPVTGTRVAAIILQLYYKFAGKNEEGARNIRDDVAPGCIARIVAMRAVGTAAKSQIIAGY